MPTGLLMKLFGSWHVDGAVTYGVSRTHCVVAPTGHIGGSLGVQENKTKKTPRYDFQQP